MFKAALCSPLPTLLLGLACSTLQAQTIPAEYLDLYSTMQQSITSFNDNTIALWDGSKPKVMFASQVLSVNSNCGPAILTPSSYQGFQRELSGHKALGVKAVVVNIDYPVLDPEFDAYGGQSAAYLALYQQVAADIHGAGLKMIVETGAIMTDPVFSPFTVQPFYNSLSTTEYKDGRAAQAALIVTQIHPDYINVVQEPDTEASQTGKPELYTLATNLDLLNTILTRVKATGTTIPVGAGVGSWQSPDSTGKKITDYISAYAAITNLDSIDIHIYPVNRDFLQRMNTIAGIAKSAGKKITISEAWSYKERDSELGDPNFSTALLYSRDVFSFWAPIDTQFLEAITNWSYYQGVEYMAAFWSGYLRAYITYDLALRERTPSELFALAQAANAAAIMSPSVSSTGSAWNSFISNPVDTNGPSAPAVTAIVYPNQVLLNYSSTDDTGIYKYVISRPGVPAMTTIESAFTEAGLVDGKCYVYSVTAFDFMNNSTTTTPPSICTPDMTAPTAPTETTATAGGLIGSNPTTSSMRITWSGATDNTGPAGISAYHIYRSVGTGPLYYLAKLPASPLNYTDNLVQQSNTKYCYQIKTQDKTLWVSPAGPTACATTLDWLPPSVPSGLTATSMGAPNVSLTWNASTDGVGVAGYEVQRRQGVSGPFSIIPGAIQQTKFLDTGAVTLPDTVAPTVSVTKPTSGSTVRRTIAFSASAYDVGVATTYTWQVRAMDAAGNKSAWGSPATVTHPPVGGVLASVAFYVDGASLSVLTAAPYYVVWDSRTVSNGSHTFTIRATDTAGNSTSATMVATVAN